ncbi:hypothetical protein V8E51_018624 [Hyaloscypha variabilis]
MFLHVLVLWIFLWETTAAAVSDPMITAAPNPPHEILRRLAHKQRLQKKAATTSDSSFEIENEMLSYCFGDGGICDQELSIFHECGGANGPSTQTIDLPTLEVCECQSGFFAADQACGWCQFAFNSSMSVALEPNTYGISVCSSNSVPLAPIPASIEAALSSWNASYTGAKSAGGTGGAAPSTPGLTSSLGTGNSTELSGFGLGTTTSTFYGGGGGQNTAPPLASNTGATQPSSTPNASSREVCFPPGIFVLFFALWIVMPWLQ